MVFGGLKRGKIPKTQILCNVQQKFTQKLEFQRNHIFYFCQHYIVLKVTRMTTFKTAEFYSNKTTCYEKICTYFQFVYLYVFNTYVYLQIVHLLVD